MLKKISCHGVMRVLAACVLMMTLQCTYAQKSTMRIQISLFQNQLFRHVVLLCSASLVAIAATALLYRFLRYHLVERRSHLKLDSKTAADFIWFLITLVIITLFLVPFFIFVFFVGC